MIADVWEAIARARPAAACIAQGGRRLTWTEFNQQANDFAQQLLDSGLGHQGKLGLALRNCPEFLVGAFACLKVGLVPVNTNFRYTAAELINIWNASDAESVVFSASIAATVAEARRSCPRVQAWYWVDDAGSKRPDWARSFSHPPASPQPESSPSPNARAPWGRSPDDLILLYTGGTTGVPKGVMWRQDDVFAILNATAATRYDPAEGVDGVARLQSEDQRYRPRFMPCGPLVHAAAAFSTYGVLGAGGSVVLLPDPRFNAVEVLDTIDAEMVTHLSIIGEAHARPLAEHLSAEPQRWSLSSLRLITSAGMALLPETRARLLAACPGAVCVDILGSSEAPQLGRSRSSRTDFTPHGTFEPGPNVRVVDADSHDVVPGSEQIGALVTRGRAPLGYYNDAGTGTPLFRIIDGERWVATGDLASVGADGVLHLRGRASSVINTGGEKVYANEVEDLLLAHPGVADAAVVGLPHDVLGQMIVAGVQSVTGATIDATELARHLRISLAGYKVPKRIFLLESLGRGDNGKIDQLKLTQRLAALADTAVDQTGASHVARSSRRS